MGQGQGIGHAPTWQHLLHQYRLTEDEALAYGQNPVDVLEPIAKARIPILHIVSENDSVVPSVGEHGSELRSAIWHLAAKYG